MEFKQWLEMAITNFQLQGDWDSPRKYGYSNQDKGILTNQSAVEKIHRLWANSKNDFELYFLKSKDAYKYVEIGEVSSQWVKSILKVDIQPKPNAITVIFTNNTGAEKVPLSAWTMAHRLGHAVRRDQFFQNFFFKEVERDFKEIAKNLYQTDNIKAVALAVGTMRSVRMNNLRNFYEFIYELLAQYIITGKIKFNPLPKALLVRKRMAWGRPANQYKYADDDDLKDWDTELQGYIDKYEGCLDTIFNGLVGKIFVM